jgi:NTE family protein
LNTKTKIALVLSGGGIRAMVFHLGVLHQLAERGLLERVERISTVSGGSLLIGLVLQENNLQWPSSATFLSTVFPNLRGKLCQRSLQWGAVRQLLQPSNLRFLLTRANLLALALKKEWHVQGKLADLPATPEWSINGTTAENGKRFRFKRTNIGDYEIGYAAADNFPLADALAVSAAFPGGFGPLGLKTRLYKWYRRPWGAPQGTEKLVDIGYKALHLYDGGVYDNLGLEPFFDAGRGESKLTDNYILVSDAGAPLAVGFSFLALNPFRLKRVADIMADQSHALRVRSFHHYIHQDVGRGALLFIGTPLEASLPCKSAEYASGFPTTLRRINTSEFDRIAQHGQGVAKQMPDISTDTDRKPKEHIESSLSA